MANKMVANVKALTQGVDSLTKKVNELYGALSKVQQISAKSITTANGAINAIGGDSNLTKGASRPGTGADGARGLPTQTDMNPRATQTSNKATFTFDQKGDQAEGMSDQGRVANAIGGVAKIVTAPLAGYYASMPGTQATLSTALNYYQAGLKTPGISRAYLEKSTMANMRGGESSVGSGGTVAAILAGRGYQPGTANFAMAQAEVGGAYKYLGINNEAATNAIAGMHTGKMGANLFQYGITTYDTKTGKDKSMGQIAKELMNTMTGGAKVSVKDVQESFQKGALGANLASMGFDQTQQEMLHQAMVDLAGGRNPDLQTRSDAQGKDKNSNDMLTAQGRTNTAQSETMAKAEKSLIQGFENATDAVEAFNRMLRSMPGFGLMARGKGFVEGVSDTNAGEGIKATVNGLLDGIKMLFKAVTGGGSTGYGAGFGDSSLTRGIGGGASGAITAGFGETNPDVWASSGGKHTGVDYEMKVGTPVKAWKEGVVSAVNINPDYGVSVMVDHPDGYQSLYGHLSAREVNLGDKVSANQRIGKSGDTGNTTGPHLHFEVRSGKNNPVDPATAGGGSGIGIGGSYISIMPGADEVTGSSGDRSGDGTPYVEGQTWSKKALDDKVLRETLTNAGFAGQSLENAMKVVRAESGGRPGALNPDSSTGDYSLGLFQINMIGDLGKRRNANYLRDYGKYGYKGIESLYDPAINARIAYDISVQGTKWSDAWVNTSNKLKLGGGGHGFGAHLPSAPQRNIGGGSSAAAAVSSPAISSVQGNKTVNVTLNINQASEAEAVRFAKKVKEYLENETEISRMGS
jgi:murein DD-endopeptidase MepM/ murein hydrolase activator NlpD